MKQTEPKPALKNEVDPKYLVAGRYGTKEMCDLLGPDKTIDSILKVQGLVPKVISEMHPSKVPPEAAEDIESKANISHVDPDEVRAEEARTRHDVIAITNTLADAVEPGSRPHIGKYMTSADSTETAKAIRMKEALRVLVDSAENLKDIVLERAYEWKDIPHMQVTHLYDALPETFGRAFAHFGERLYHRIGRLKKEHDRSIYGKYSDATGNYHAASAVSVDGRKLEERLCDELKIKHMIASSQVPAREFVADVVVEIAKYVEVVADMAHHIRWLMSDDVNCLYEKKEGKGSSSMPHKDKKGGNPIVQEQAESVANALRGYAATMLSSIRMDYGRELSGSLSDRIAIDDSFKLADHITRAMAKVVYNLEPVHERIEERFERTYGTVTSSRILAYITDPDLVDVPMSRKDAHDLIGELATTAYKEKIPFAEVLARDHLIFSRLGDEKIKELSDPFTYLGESAGIINHAVHVYHRNVIFDEGN